jgi:cellulose synthase/poly-beta-1,6-N-acetylglucosamine synthase-like glycosyltransferase
MINTDVSHTFVVCAYKKTPYLEECIQSLISQKSVKDKKSQIVLYTSTPNNYIEEICKKYEIPIYIGKGGSIGADWNGALAAVQTKYVTIAHQDDIYEPDYGQKVIETFEKEETRNIVFSDYYEVDENTNRRERNLNLKIKTFGLKLLSLFENKSYQRRVYAFGNFICCPAVSYNLERLKDFKFDEKFKMAVDWDAWERIMKRPGNIQYISLKLMAHRIHNESETTNNTVDKNREKEEHLMFKRYWGKKMTSLLMKVYINNQKGNE